MKILKAKFILLSLLSLCLACFSPWSMAMAQTEVKVKAKGAMVIDLQVGQILAEQDSQENVEVGALSKALSLYLILKAVDKGEIQLSDSVPISDQAYDLSQDYDIYNVPLRQDFTYTVEELIESVAVTGANGSMLALAEFHSGSEQAFVKEMRAQLAEWEYDGAEIYNCTGLASDFVPGDPATMDQGSVNKMSAAACATASFHLLQVFPELLEYSQQGEAVFKQDTDDPYEMSSPNEMLADGAQEYPGVSGLFLGASAKDGYSAMITAEKNDLAVLSVVLGTDHKDSNRRYNESKKLLDAVYAMYVSTPVIRQGQEVTQMAQVKVNDGKDDYASLEYGEALVLATPIIDTAPRMTYHFMANEEVMDPNGKLQAPVKAGTEIGQMVIDVEGQKSKFLKFSTGNTVSVKVKTSIEEVNWFEKTVKGIGQTVDASWEATRKFFTDLFN
ncbi:hypothetical protein M0R79_03270 [Ignavigranum ruoffiae]|uniref:D-alanyl-D-alanine carboxypeptidase family protein n=1 Tax=Ignavigranum ruoffiae TaxID=89093 RepID=UPI00205AE121|nr:hypothetical protein [Ignavigranum ruoffiae]UPQ86407.1 hypothetical protein M0R79_03270 [Ignavigranum ruoffiae]